MNTLQANPCGSPAGLAENPARLTPGFPWVAHTWVDPPRSRDRILLATALTQLCAGEWGMSGDDVADAAARPATNPNDSDRVRSASNLIGRMLLEGDVQSWARPFGGGEPVSLPASAWELDDFGQRMSTSAIDPEHPFDVDRKPTHWVFLSEDDWEAALANLWSGSALQRTAAPPARERPAMADKVRVELEPVTSDPTPPDPAPGGRERLIRLPEVLDRTGVSRATLYRRIGAGSFPEGRSLGGNLTAWVESEVDAWIASHA